MGFHHIWNDVAFVIEIGGAKLVRPFVPENDRQIVVPGARLAVRRRILGKVFANQDFALEVRLEREGPGALARTAAALAGPMANQEFERPPVFGPPNGRHWQQEKDTEAAHSAMICLPGTRTVFLNIPKPAPRGERFNSDHTCYL